MISIKKLAPHPKKKVLTKKIREVFTSILVFWSTSPETSCKKIIIKVVTIHSFSFTILFLAFNQTDFGECRLITEGNLAPTQSSFGCFFLHYTEQNCTNYVLWHYTRWRRQTWFVGPRLQNQWQFFLKKYLFRVEMDKLMLKTKIAECT